jgi:hypothetical protein
MPRVPKSSRLRKRSTTSAREHITVFATKSPPETDISIQIAKSTIVEAKTFKRNLEETLKVLRESFAGSMRRSVGSLSIDEIKVALEVSADGKVGILGAGTGNTGKSGITVKLKREE